jgi:hypothetical protein
MSPGTRTYPKANFGWLTAARLEGRRAAFRLPVAPSRVAQARAAGGRRRGSVGEHGGLGLGQRDKIIYRVALFTILLERAPLSGGWGELESRFDPPGGWRGGSLVNTWRLPRRVATRAL